MRKIPPVDRLILQEILEHDFGGSGTTRPSQQRLAAMIGTTDRSVQRAIRTGVELGIFSVTRVRGARNKYWIDYNELENFNKKADDFLLRVISSG
jgi:hypothetical protein